MASQSRPATPEEVVEKVMRRVEVAQVNNLDSLLDEYPIDQFPPLDGKEAAR